MEHSTEVLYNRTMVYCSPEHRFGSDALLLARFCEPKRAQKAADLCSGSVSYTHLVGLTSLRKMASTMMASAAPTTMLVRMLWMTMVM